jgi:hydroxyacylglutathione hydrolase
MLQKTFKVGVLGCNCTLLADEQTRECLVIDPGGDTPRLLDEIHKGALRVVGIVHTHAHIDHLGATAQLARETGAPTYLHADDNFLHVLLPMQAAVLGLPTIEQPIIDHALTDQQTLRFGRYEAAVLHTPGHSPGSVCLVVLQAELCLSGDTLFAGSVGRTDIWGGDAHAITRSIRDRLYTLNGAVQVIPGHGPQTTIDKERSTNPYVSG